MTSDGIRSQLGLALDNLEFICGLRLVTTANL
jgi:hypothetical protein